MQEAVKGEANLDEFVVHSPSLLLLLLQGHAERRRGKIKGDCRRTKSKCGGFDRFKKK